MKEILERCAEIKKCEKEIKEKKKELNEYTEETIKIFFEKIGLPLGKDIYYIDGSKGQIVLTNGELSFHKYTKAGKLSKNSTYVSVLSIFKYGFIDNPEKKRLKILEEFSPAEI